MYTPPPGERKVFQVFWSFSLLVYRFGTPLARVWHGQSLDKQGLGTVSRPFTPPPEKRDLESAPLHRCIIKISRTRNSVLPSRKSKIQNRKSKIQPWHTPGTVLARPWHGQNIRK